MLTAAQRARISKQNIFSTTYLTMQYVVLYTMSLFQVLQCLQCISFLCTIGSFYLAQLGVELTCHWLSNSYPLYTNDPAMSPSQHTHHCIKS